MYHPTALYFTITSAINSTPPSFSATSSSSNVVGYSTANLREGFTMMTPFFVNVADSETGLDLTSFTPSGEDIASDDINVQTLTAEGKKDMLYYYHKPRNKAFRWTDEDGADLEAGDVVFSPVQGLWVAGIDSSALQTAGGVSTADRTIPLREGFTALGNFTATELDLTSIIPEGEDIASDDINIQTLTAEGKKDKLYYYHKPRNKSFRWTDEDGADIAEGEVKFAPGQGLWVAGIDGSSITIPGPEL